MADIRVGIVSWNTADLLDRCLAAVPAALAGTDAEVVVVDNASRDSSAEVAARHAGVRVVRNDTNRGYAKAMNQALADTDAPVLIALNPDTEPPPGSLERLAQTLHDHPEAGIVVPRLVYESGDLQHSVYRFPQPRQVAIVGLLPRRVWAGDLGRRWWLEGVSPHDQSGPVDWAIGAVHVIRGDALEGAAPYSERWFMYVEDLELCWRLHSRGWVTWLAADIEIVHSSNASGSQAWAGKRAARFWGETYDFYGLVHGRLRARWFAAVNTLGVLLHIAGNVAGAFGRDPARSRRRATVHELRAVLPVHARAVLAGPPPPAPPPRGS